MRTTRQFLLHLATLAAVSLAPAALADDLPGRVGRIADIGGRVYIATEQRAEDWIDASRNDSVTSGDNLWVSGDGRAEIDYGGGQVRLAGDTNVHLARLDDAILGLFVAQGRAIVRVRVLEPGDAARIDTPNTQVALTRPGLYRIDVSPDRTRTEIVVREGEATVAFATGIQQVLPGQSALAEGAEPDRVDVRSGFYVDGFDTWSAERDRRYERSRSTTYVSPQMVGYADLDEYGRWESVPDYGALWYPTGVATDWAPYRYGRWSWVGSFGWTWVDDAPWGYAPFHYGRWVHHRGRWGWAPGGYVARPVWSPAMVAWYGGSGWSLSVTYGAPVYGWVPLAWGEPFIPWWRNCSNRCWTMYNRPYAVHLAERPHAPPSRYRNWSAPGGVTAVPGGVLTGRRPVHSQVVQVRPNVVGTAPVLTQMPAVDRPSPGRIPGARPPAAAPMPAAAYQTKPMRLPPAATPAATPAGPPAAGRVPVGPSQSQGQATRPAARAPATPGTWGPTGQPGQPPAQAMPQGRSQATTAPPPGTPGAQGMGSIQREPRPQGTVPGQAQPRQAPPSVGAPVPRSGSAPPPQQAQPQSVRPVPPPQAQPQAGRPLPQPQMQQQPGRSQPQMQQQPGRPQPQPQAQPQAGRPLPQPAPSGAPAGAPPSPRAASQGAPSGQPVAPSSGRPSSPQGGDRGPREVPGKPEPKEQAR